MENTNNGDHVKKQTLIGAVVFSLVIGFVAGTVYSSFKLPSKSNLSPKGNVASTNSAPQENSEESAKIASQIFQVEQALKNNPEDVTALVTLGNLFFDSHQYANAIEAYNKSLILEPNNVSVMTDLGTMYRRNKQPDMAVKTFDRAIQIDPKFETARFNKGVVLLHDLQDFEGGIKAWEDLIAQNPTAMAPNGESVDSIIQRMKSNK